MIGLSNVDEEPRGLKRTVPMKVLCLGLGRTGTESLCIALTMLGIPTYHGWHTIANAEHNMLWYEACLSKYKNKGKIWTRADYDQMLGRHSACTDNPAAMFAIELIDAYPEAKVILNKRPIEKWWASWAKNVLPFRENWPLWLLAHWDLEFFQTFVIWNRMQDFLFRNDTRRNARKIYNEQCALVRGATADGNLLEWEPEDGWEPLCKFLGLSVPNEQFPHENQAKEFEETVDAFFQPRINRAIRNLSIFTAVAVGVISFSARHYLARLVDSCSR